MFTYKLTTTCLKDLKDDYISNTRIVTNSCTILNTIHYQSQLTPPSQRRGCQPWFGLLPRFQPCKMQPKHNRKKGEVLF